MKVETTRKNHRGEDMDGWLQTLSWKPGASEIELLSEKTLGRADGWGPRVCMLRDEAKKWRSDIRQGKGATDTG